MIRHSLIAIVALALAILLGACRANSAVGPSESVAITDNAHLDVLSIQVDGHGVSLGLDHSDHKDILEPEATIVRVRSSSRTLIGADSSFQFLGQPGASVWHLNAGWSVRRATAGQFENDSLTVRMIDVHGPGNFAVWRSDAQSKAVAIFASTMIFPQELRVRYNAHVHRNWSFTATGKWTVRFEVNAVLQATGQVVTSGIRTFTFVVEE
jgi:surface-anchored protein